LNKFYNITGFEVLTAALTNTAVYRDITVKSVKGQAVRRLNLHVGSINHARNEHEKYSEKRYFSVLPSLACASTLKVEMK
jgi:hypothetical protein